MMKSDSQSQRNQHLMKPEVKEKSGSLLEDSSTAEETKALRSKVIKISNHRTEFEFNF